MWQRVDDIIYILKIGPDTLLSKEINPKWFGNCWSIGEERLFYLTNSVIFYLTGPQVVPSPIPILRFLDMDVISIVFHFQMSDKCPIHKKYWSSTQSYLLWIIVYDSSYTFIIHHFFTSPDRSNIMTEDLLVWNYIKLCNVSYLTLSVIKMFLLCQGQKASWPYGPSHHLG